MLFSNTKYSRAYTETVLWLAAFVVVVSGVMFLVGLYDVLERFL